MRGTAISRSSLLCRSMLKFINSLLHYLTFEASLTLTSTENFVLNAKDIVNTASYMPFVFISLFLVIGFFCLVPRSLVES